MKRLSKVAVMMLTLAIMITSLSISVFALESGDQIDPKDKNSITIYTYIENALKDTKDRDNKWVLRYLDKVDTISTEATVSFTIDSTGEYYQLKAGVEADSLYSAARTRYKSAKVSSQTQNMQDGLGVEADTEGAMAAMEGFVPVINIILGAITVIITMLLAVFTAFDVCYITFPVFRNKCEEQKASGQGMMVGKTANGGTKLRWVSDEAQFVVDQCNVDSGKSPLAAYLGKRIFSYIAVSIILFILLTGNINVITNLALKIVSYIVDMVSSLG